MAPRDPDPYELLGVAETASDKVVNRAWRDLIKKCHPDYAVDEADREARETRSVALNQARDTLLDPDRRAELNRSRAARVAPSSGGARGPQSRPGPRAGGAGPAGPAGGDWAGDDWAEVTWSDPATVRPREPRVRTPDDETAPFALAGDIAKAADSVFLLMIRGVVALIRRFSRRGRN
jgi:curved DNA-binding protein CbpA